ncbi:hypothetical protein [Pseudomonas sp. 37 R 15]|uniref:hypothetical protein n=1 Tax=Pseudomonas sp. 37 R 15 TaxID=1844104 RepID=UPI0008123525|nr:hypothetical protein [Pseudomonas sp. 37 R 15]CRM40444.1 hypothetical protein [Pseudomonas sp. 37 R 15]
MISNHLSLVEALRPASDELAAQVAEFVAVGGEIEQAPAYNYKPKPITYSNQMPPAPKPFVRRRVEPVPERLPTKLEEQIEARKQRLAKVMELGISRRKVCGKLGINTKTLARILANHAIDYPLSAPGGKRCAA